MNAKRTVDPRVDRICAELATVRAEYRTVRNEFASVLAERDRIRAERDELMEAATAASNVLAELYAKYSTKVGPFATQAQKANGMLRAALAKVSS